MPYPSARSDDRDDRPNDEARPGHDPASRAAAARPHRCGHCRGRDRQCRHCAGRLGCRKRRGFGAVGRSAAQTNTRKPRTCPGIHGRADRRPAGRHWQLVGTVAVPVSRSAGPKTYRQDRLRLRTHSHRRPHRRNPDRRTRHYSRLLGTHRGRAVRAQSGQGRPSRPPPRPSLPTLRTGHHTADRRLSVPVLCPDTAIVGLVMHGASERSYFAANFTSSGGKATGAWSRHPAANGKPSPESSPTSPASSGGRPLNRNQDDRPGRTRPWTTAMCSASRTVRPTSGLRPGRAGPGTATISCVHRSRGGDRYEGISPARTLRPRS
jgi:hypothetical protein